MKRFGLRFTLKYLFLTLFVIFYMTMSTQSAHASVGAKYSKMAVKYHMKRISLLKASVFDPYLLNMLNVKNGAKAYKFNYKGVKFIAVFNTNNLCYEEFALNPTFSILPLKVLIGKNLYKYAPLKILSYYPLQYERIALGSGQGRIIYAIQYINNGYLAMAIIPSLSPQGY